MSNKQGILDYMRIINMIMLKLVIEYMNALN